MADKQHPLEKASWWSQLNFSWLSGYVRVMQETLFEQDMHTDLPHADGSKTNANKLKPQADKLWTQLKAVFGRRLYLLYCTTVLRSLLFGFTSYLLYLISEEIQTQAEEFGHIEHHEFPMALLCALIVTTVLEIYLAELADFERIRQGMRVQAALAVNLAKKVLNMSVLNPSAHDEGTLTNNLQTDVDRVANSVNAINDLVHNFSSLVVTAVVGVYLFTPIFLLIYVTIGVAGLPMSYIADKWMDIGNEWMKAKDNRISAWKHIFGVVRFIKSKAWENAIYKKIELIRRKEIKLQFLSFCCFAGWIFIMIAAPAIGTVAFLKVYFFHHVLEMAKIGVSLRLILKIGMMVFDIPASFNFINELRISLKRLEEVFAATEVQSRKSVSFPDDEHESAAAIEIKSKKFYWRVKPTKEEGEDNNNQTDTSTSKDESSQQHVPSSFLQGPLLADDDSGRERDSQEMRSFELDIEEFSAAQQQLTCLIGKTGCGKSSLLYAVLREMSSDSTDGLKVCGTVGFISQRPWIMNSTIKKNIVLDRAEDENRLRWAIKYSTLEDDMVTFDKGLDQETGENGDALSGGQRVRLSLAQILYQDPAIYLFDDILSALDSDVAEFIMKETILKQLANKTIVIATHAINYLHHMSKIYVMDSGKIVTSGKFTDLTDCEIYNTLVELSQKSSHLTSSESQRSKVNQPQANNDVATVANGPDVNMKKQTEKMDEVLEELMVPEDRERGHISLDTYIIFLKLFGGGFGLVSIMLLYLIDHSLLVYSYIMLTKWSDNFMARSINSTLVEFLMVNLGSASLEAFSAFILSVFSYYLSRGIHSKMVYSVLHSQIENFLGRIPSGRILNRFTKDIEQIDDSLYWGFECYFYKLSKMIIQIWIFGLYLGKEIVACILMMAAVCMWYQRQFMAARREILRLDAITRTPMLNTLLDICKGLPTIRGLDKSEWMLQKFVDRFDDTLKNRILKEGLNMWYRLRASLAVCFLCVLPAYLIIFYRTPQIVVSDMMVTIIMGTALSTDMIELLFEWSRFEGCLIAVERCYNFHKIIPEAGYKCYQESAKHINGSDQSFRLIDAAREKQSQSVITEGRVVFYQVTFRYLTASKPTLKNVSFEILPKQKIGVVGRTGCGKTTLIKLIWKCLDPETGDITIDGHNLNNVDLKSLRSQMSLVTQEAAMIAGNLRDNLDLFVSRDSRDAEMNTILDRLGFKHAEYLKAGLDMDIQSEGSNLSAGEKQLISVARALLEKKKLVLLDEATASIDLDTEQTVQKCLKEDFEDSTMIIVAHRTQTILGCDKLFIFEEGVLTRQCTPSEYVGNNDTLSFDE